MINIGGDSPIAEGGRDAWAEGAPVHGVGLEPVRFGYDSARIDPDEGGKIVAAAEYLKRNARVSVVVEGHCDERGSREYNLSLGERRALAARAYLLELGIESGRIHTRSLGEEKPADPGHSEGARARNRRAEFIPYQ